MKFPPSSGETQFGGSACEISINVKMQNYKSVESVRETTPNLSVFFQRSANHSLKVRKFITIKNNKPHQDKVNPINIIPEKIPNRPEEPLNNSNFSTAKTQQTYNPYPRNLFPPPFSPQPAPQRFPYTSVLSPNSLLCRPPSCRYILPILPTQNKRDTQHSRFSLSPRSDKLSHRASAKPRAHGEPAHQLSARVSHLTHARIPVSGT